MRMTTFDEPASCPSPRSASGGRGGWSASGGSEGSSIASPGLPGEVHAKRAEGVPAPSLSPDLMDDLLDPSNTPMQICKMHGLTLTDLANIVESTAFQRAAANLNRITTARTSAIDSNTKLQTQSLHRAIAQDAYLAAADMDQAITSHNPKLAATKSRYLETARKATSSLGARTRRPAAQRAQSTNGPPQCTATPQAQPPNPSSPAHPRQVQSPLGRGGLALPPAPHLHAFPFPPNPLPSRYHPP